MVNGVLSLPECEDCASFPEHADFEAAENSRARYEKHISDVIPNAEARLRAGHGQTKR
jgi:hypothetical protein